MALRRIRGSPVTLACTVATAHLCGRYSTLFFRGETKHSSAPKGRPLSGRPAGTMADTNGGKPPLVDIAVNLCDPMFRGVYRGKSKHEDDLALVLERAWQAGVTHMLVTGTSLEESREALQLVARDRGEAGRPPRPPCALAL